MPGGGLRLGERDAQLLTDLYLHAVMTRHQLQALYFGSVTRCNMRLRQLFDGGFVTREFPPAAPFGGEAVYALGPAAIPTVAARLTGDGLDGDVAAIRQRCRQGLSPALLEHTLAIGEFYLAVRQAVVKKPSLDTDPGKIAARTLEMDRWLPELLCRHEYDIRRLSPSSGSTTSRGAGNWQREVFKPDGFVRLRDCGAGRYRSYFLEIDRGHVSSEKFLGKLHSHRRYLESGLFAEVYGAGEFRTLVVTTSGKRLDNLRALIQDASEDLFWLTTFDAIAARGALAAIWVVPGQGEQAALI